MERLQEIETRKAEIKALLESDTECDLNALETEMDALDEEVRSLEEQRKEAEKKAEIEAEERAREMQLKTAELEQAERRERALEIGEGIVKANVLERKEENKMEYRNTPEYIDAYAEYIKSEGKDKRSLEILMRDADPTKITTTNDTAPNGTASIAVPDFVDEIVHTAWEREEILSRVRRTYFKGNLKINFEISGTPAVAHEEGADAIDREQLVHGIVTLNPTSIKKIVAFSTEVMDMRGETFLRYIYDEITYRVFQVISYAVVGLIANLPDTAVPVMPAAAEISTNTLSLDLVAQALGKLSDEATNPVIIMNKATWSAFKALQYAAQYPVDPFEGLPVLFSNAVASYTTAIAGSEVAYMLVGDLSAVTLNFPNGDDIKLLFDELTRKDEDMIEVLGRVYVGFGVTQMYAFTKVISEGGAG